MLKRLISNWVYGGFLAGILILCLTPVLARGWPNALLATFLCLPVYMLHQYEEHDNDRFRAFVNRLLGRGREALTPLAVFITNIIGVWAVLGAAFCLAATASSRPTCCCSTPSYTLRRPLPHAATTPDSSPPSFSFYLPVDIVCGR